MPPISCKVCGHLLDDRPVFTLAHVPRAAQALPFPSELHLDRGEDLDVFECPACGLVQLCCEPVPYYREVITAAGLSPAMRAFRTEQLREFSERFGLEGRTVLEVGCGRGEMLDLMASLGLRPLGIEAGGASVRHGLERGRPLVQGYLEPGFKLDAPPPSAFATFNFLEHAPDPHGLLTCLATLLPPGAPGIVEVPSFEHMVETDRFYDFVPDHVSYFTRESLTHLLQRSGFQVLDCQRVWHGYDLAATVVRRTPFDPTPWETSRHRLVSELQTFLRAHTENGRRIAVWGASHQALTLLALASAESIQYVIDSAPFKQGRFTPVVHTPIVAPDHLHANPVDTILVMAAGYSSEIQTILQRDFHFQGATWILKEDGITPGHDCRYG